MELLTVSGALKVLGEGKKITSDALKKGEYVFLDKSCDLISICADIEDYNINNVLVEDNLRIYEEPKQTEIKLSKHEIQSGLNRVKAAESLITQLPLTHEGRNTWLMNYGTSEQSKGFRKSRGLDWSDITTSAIIRNEVNFNDCDTCQYNRNDPDNYQSVCRDCEHY